MKKRGKPTAKEMVWKREMGAKSGKKKGCGGNEGQKARMRWGKGRKTEDSERGEGVKLTKARG